MKTLCVGHASYDITLPVEAFPKENTKNRIPKKIECGGGPASNAAYLLAKWGLDTSFAGVVGNDFYGVKMEDEFKKIGVDLTYFQKKEGAKTSSSYIIANTSTGTRTILTAHEESLGHLEKAVEGTFDAILVDGEELEASREVLLKNPNAISVMDVGKMREATKVLGPMVTYFVCSKDFAEDYTNTKLEEGDLSSLENSYDLLKHDFQTNIVITLEAAGCYTKIDGMGKIIPSIPVKAIDSTGAGDIFHGAFTYFVAEGYSLEEALFLSNVTGAISVTRLGSRNSIPTLEEVLTVARKYASLS